MPKALFPGRCLFWHENSASCVLKEVCQNCSLNERDKRRGGKGKGKGKKRKTSDEVT